jgi:DNA-binding transcriptional regulator YiaG
MSELTGILVRYTDGEIAADEAMGLILAQEGEARDLNRRRFSELGIREIIEILRAEYGFTLAEVAVIFCTKYETVKSWAIGRYAPREDTRFRFIETFSYPERDHGKVRGFSWGRRRRGKG